MKRTFLILALVVVLAIGGAWTWQNLRTIDTPPVEDNSYTPEMPSSLILVNLKIGDFYPLKTVAIAEGSTVLELLETVSNDENFELVVADGGAITSIDDKTASWTYKVNGQSPSAPMRDYVLKNEDQVEVL